jgi:hypothetical protein
MAQGFFLYFFFIHLTWVDLLFLLVIWAGFFFTFFKFII